MHKQDVETQEIEEDNSYHEEFDKDKAEVFVVSKAIYYIKID